MIKISDINIKLLELLHFEKVPQMMYILLIMNVSGYLYPALIGNVVFMY